MKIVNEVKESKNITNKQFNCEIIQQEQPVVFRGLNRDWPIVKAYNTSPESFIGYLKQFDRGQTISAMVGPPDIKGRFFYREDLQGFNYKKKSERFSVFLQALLELKSIASAPVIAMQSMELSQNFKDLAGDNLLSLLEPTVTPRLWLGNKTVTTTHYDTMQNIACAVAGQRRIVLFPPEQVSNLYPGPLLLTPAGTPMSMVDLQNPDFDKYPNFKDALEVAQEVILEPGDALYIPSYWWHNVESKNSISGLINYWWSPTEASNVTAYQSMLHSLLTIPELPLKQRLVWQKLFDHYVFQTTSHPAEHLPDGIEDIITNLPYERKKHLMKLLAGALTQ